METASLKGLDNPWVSWQDKGSKVMIHYLWLAHFYDRKRIKWLYVGAVREPPPYKRSR
jgi:hypothetical protein